MNSRSRILIGLIIQLVAVLFSLASWIDPLEGGLAMTIAIGLTALSFIVGRVRLPKFTWITASVSVVFLVAFWALYVSEIPADPAAQANFEPSNTIMSLLSVYTALAVAFICSTVFYAIQQFTEFRRSKAGDK